MARLAYSTRLALYLTTMIILERAASRVQGKASPNATTPDSNSSIAVLSKTARELPDKFIRSLNHQQKKQQQHGGIDYHDQDDMSEDSAMYWLRIEMIKAKILPKLQMDKVPVIKEKPKESKIKELLASLNLIGEDEVDEKKEEEEMDYFGTTTKIIVFIEKDRMASVAFHLCVAVSLVLTIVPLVAQQGKPTLKERRDKTPSTLLQAPQYSHYFVSKDQPVKLTWAATYVCKIQITCNGEKFDEGDGRVCRKTCQGCKTRKKTRTIKFSDFPGGNRTMKCQAKFWGINSTKTEKITLTKVFLLRNFGKVKLRHVVHANATVILRCKAPMGYPPPNVTWYKNGEPLFFCCGRSLRASAKRLVMKGVSTNDSGHYQCVAENMAARRQGPLITLEVRGETVEVGNKNAPASDCNKSKGKCYGDPADGYNNGSNKSSSWESYSPMLIVGTEDDIFTFELQNNSRRRRFKAKNVASLECDYGKRHIYWSNRREINELNLHTGVSEIFPFHLDQLNSVPSPNSLAFDWINYKLYWTDAKVGVIYLGDLRNRRRVRLIEGKLHLPKAIAASPSDGFIYWTVWGQTSKIMRARLDGTAETVLIREGIPFPNALALDESNRRLFWAGTDERKYGIIESVSLDGLNRNVTFYSQGYHPYSLDIYEGFVYWADWGKNAVLRISSNGDREEMVITGLKKPMGLKLFHMRTLDGKQENSCDQNNGDCGYLCVNLPFRKRSKCMCPKDMNLQGDGKTCKRSQIIPQDGESKKNEPLSPTELTVIIVAVVLLLVVLVYILKKILSRVRQEQEGLPPVPPVGILNVEEDMEEEHTTERTELQANSRSADTSSVADQQLSCNAEPLGACVARENPPVRVQVHRTNTVVYNSYHNTVNMTQMNTTNYTCNAVELRQSGGVAVVGDKAEINYHRSP